MNDSERAKRAEDSNVNFIKDNLCDKDGDKPFVFISYKSDDWEIVLQDIVYRLVKKGLNVYFDGSFDIHADLWIKQFPANMESSKCKGIISFIDMKYVTSYATLLELMYSQTVRANLNNPIEFVPINLEKLEEDLKDEKEEDTGLGKGNIHAPEEVKLFNETFDELVEKGILKDGKYVYKKDQLTKQMCYKLTEELLRNRGKNDNELYGSLEDIIRTIKDACGPEVFSEPREDNNIMDTVAENSSARPAVSQPPQSGAVECTLRQAARLNIKKSEFDTIELVGLNSCAGYSVGKRESTAELCREFLNKMIEAKGVSYIKMVNQKTGREANPFFIPTSEVEQKKVAYKAIEKHEDWSMCTNFSQGDWLKILAKRIGELEDFGEEAFRIRITGYQGDQAVGQSVGAAPAANPVPAVEAAGAPVISGTQGSSSGTEYHFQNAKLVYENGSFLLKKGSVIKNGPTQYYTSGMKRIYEEGVRQGAIVPAERAGFMEVTGDLSFDSPSAAAKFVSGGSENGWDKWRSREGESLNEFRSKHPELFGEKRARTGVGTAAVSKSGKRGLDI